MQVHTIKTHKITSADKNILSVLDTYITHVEEKSIIVVTSKIIAICQGRIFPIESSIKDDLIQREADLYLPRSESRYNVTLTIKDNLLVPSAGIDESNGFNHYVLWPKSLQETTNKIREHIKERFSLKHVGVIISDSKTTPLRWGVTGIALTHSGFLALKNLIGEKDIFERTLTMTQVNVMDGLAAAAVLVMGEGSEQTPIALLTDLPFVKFQDRNPSKKELGYLKIALKDDLYEPLLRVAWRRKITVK